MENIQNPGKIEEDPVLFKHTTTEPAVEEVIETTSSEAKELPLFSSIEEVSSAITAHEINTTTKFVHFATSKNFGGTSLKAGQRLYWFPDGVPYIKLGYKCLMCHFGFLRKNKDAQPAGTKDDNKCAKKRRRVRGTKKHNCPARIVIKELLLFPQSRLEKLTMQTRREAGRRLKDQLFKASSPIQGPICYRLVLPKIDDHRNHLIGEAPGARNPIDERLVGEIKKLVSAGISRVSDVKSHLKRYTEQLLDDVQISPLATDRRFNPTDRDIRNYVYRSKLKNKPSKKDQDNPQVALPTWDSSDNVFYEEDSSPREETIVTIRIPEIVMPQLKFNRLPGDYGVARLAPESPLPVWASEAASATNGFFSLTRTRNELSLVMSVTAIPEDVLCERDFIILEVVGPLDFSLVGILSAICRLLQEASISVFVVSTYDTDYVLVKKENESAAIEQLLDAGHVVHTN